jgi:polynucleotide 5'-kinase involved in rRNA processing
MLPFLAGCVLLASEAAHGGARSLVADTTGLVAESGGGRTLKTSVAESLQAATIIALQREGELEHIIGPMRGDRRFSVHELALAEAVRTRSRQTRANRRRRLFRDYFDSAAERSLPATTPVYAPHPPREGTLLGLLDERGFCLGLGCVVEPGERLRVRTPITTTDCLVALRAGSIRIDPEDGCEID